MDSYTPPRSPHTFVLPTRRPPSSNVSRGPSASPRQQGAANGAAGDTEAPHSSRPQVCVVGEHSCPPTAEDGPLSAAEGPLGSAEASAPCGAPLECVSEAPQRRETSVSTLPGTPETHGLGRDASGPAGASCGEQTAPVDVVRHTQQPPHPPQFNANAPAFVPLSQMARHTSLPASSPAAPPHPPPILTSHLGGGMALEGAHEPHSASQQQYGGGRRRSSFSLGGVEEPHGANANSSSTNINMNTRQQRGRLGSLGGVGVCPGDENVCAADFGGDVGALAHHILTLCNKRRERALDLYREAVALGGLAAGPGVWPAEVFAGLVQVALFLGRKEVPETVLEDMRTAGVPRPLSLYVSIMKMFASRHLYTKCLSLYEQLRQDGHDPRDFTMYSCLLSAAVETGEFERAAMFFARLCEIGTPSIKAYMQMVRVHSRRNDWQAALGLLKSMCEKGVEPDNLIFNNVLSTCVNARQIHVARAIIDEMKDSPRLLDTISYNTLLKGYAQRGEYAQAVTVLEEMKGRGVAPNDITFNTLMDCAVRSKIPDAHLYVLEEMQRHSVRPDRYTQSILSKGMGGGRAFANGPQCAAIRHALEAVERMGVQSSNASACPSPTLPMDATPPPPPGPPPPTAGGMVQRAVSASTVPSGSPHGSPPSLPLSSPTGAGGLPPRFSAPSASSYPRSQSLPSPAGQAPPPPPPPPPAASHGHAQGRSGHPPLPPRAPGSRQSASLADHPPAPAIFVQPPPNAPAAPLQPGPLSGLACVGDALVLTDFSDPALGATLRAAASPMHVLASLGLFTPAHGRLPALSPANTDGDRTVSAQLAAGRLKSLLESCGQGEEELSPESLLALVDCAASPVCNTAMSALSPLATSPLGGEDPMKELLACLNAAHSAPRRHSLQQASSTAQHDPRETAYATLIKALGHAGRADKCVELFHDAVARGLPPSMRLFSRLVDACAANACTELALGALDELRDAGKEGAELQGRAAYCKVINGFLGQTGGPAVERALELYQQMRSEHAAPDHPTYRALVKACADHRPEQLSVCLELFRDMRDCGAAPDAACFEAVLRCCLAQQPPSFGVAEGVFGDMGLAGCPEATAEACTVMATIYARCGMVEQSLEALQGQGGAACWNRVLSDCVEHRQVDRALRIFEAMHTATSPAPPDQETYTLLVRGCTAGGMLRQAVSLVRRGLDARVDVCHVMEGPGGAGDAVEALKQTLLRNGDNKTVDELRSVLEAHVLDARYFGSSQHGPVVKRTHHHPALLKSTTAPILLPQEADAPALSAAPPSAAQPLPPRTIHRGMQRQQTAVGMSGGVWGSGGLVGGW